MRSSNLQPQDQKLHDLLTELVGHLLGLLFYIVSQKLSERSSWSSHMIVLHDLMYLGSLSFIT